MKRTILEKLILVIAWTGLVCGILAGFGVGKGILESGADMCVPQALFTVAASTFISIGCWAVLMEIIAISDRIRKIEGKTSL